MQFKASSLLLRSHFNTKLWAKVLSGDSFFGKYRIISGGEGSLFEPISVNLSDTIVVFFLRFDGLGRELSRYLTSDSDLFSSTIKTTLDAILDEIDRTSATAASTIVFLPSKKTLPYVPFLTSWNSRLFNRLNAISSYILNHYTSQSLDPVMVDLDIYSTDLLSNDYLNWYWNKVPYSLKGLEFISNVLKSHITTMYETPYKVIALDLDNTLWSGVLGEDGLGGIKIGVGDPVAEAYHDVQLTLRALKELGFILVVVSKNNWKDVEEVFDSKEAMTLKKEDFAAFRVNWEDKSKNLRELSEVLSLPLGSFIFLDDSPHERSLVTSKLPEVSVIPLSRNPLARPQQLQRLTEFWKKGVTDEDLNRTNFYGVENQRRAIIPNSQEGHISWLKKLGIVLSVENVTEKTFSRCVQLFNKTNQMNMSTRRFSDALFHEFLSDKQNVCLCVKAEDSFGDYGYIGIINLTLKVNEIEITDFLLSCRVLGRSIESKLLKEVILKFATNHKVIKFNFLRTEKNVPMQDFIETLNLNESYASSTNVLLNKIPDLEELSIIWKT